MRLHQFDGGSRVPRLAVGTGDGLDLTTLTWSRYAFASPIGRTTNSTYHAVDFILIPNGITQSLEDQDARTFAHHEPVCSGIKRRGMGRRERSNG